MTVIAGPDRATDAGVTAVISYSDLIGALTTAAVVIDRTSRPVWRGVLLTGDPCGDLIVTGAGSTATVSVRLPGAVRTPGRCLVDGWGLMRICKAMVRGEPRRTTGDLPVTLDGTHPAAPTITLAGYTVPLTGLPPEDHPGAGPTGRAVADVDRATFSAALGQVLPVLGSDLTLPVLTGVHLGIQPDTITMAGTDRYRLAVDTLPATVATPRDVEELLVPGKILAACAEKWTADRVRVGVARAESVAEVDRVTFTCGQTTVSLTMIEGRYPPYGKLLSLDPRYTATIDRTVLATHVGRVLAMLTAHPDVPTGHGLTALTLTPDGVQVAPVLSDHGRTVTAPTLPATTSTVDSVRFVFNAAYLRDAVATISGDTVVFTAQTDLTKPVMLTPPADIGSSNPPYRHLIMPIRLHESQ